MKTRNSPEFLKKLKSLDVRIRNAFKETILIFSVDPMNSKLNNKLLRDEWEGYRSIRVGDVKNDYRAIYEELNEGDELIARFVAIGTHKELFERVKKESNN